MILCSFLREGFLSFPQFSLLSLFFLPTQNPLIQKPGQKPDRRIIETNHAVDIPAGLAVIPGAHIPCFQQASGYEFHQENGTGIKGASQPDTSILQPPGKGTNKSSHAVDRKHPDGGMALQLHLSSLKGLQTGPENFQTPADESA